MTLDLNTFVNCKNIQCANQFFSHCTSYSFCIVMQTSVHINKDLVPNFRIDVLNCKLLPDTIRPSHHINLIT